jgi:hypothetical protein
MSPGLQKRLRVYSFAAAIVVAFMASVPPMDTVEWTSVVIVVLGLLVGIFNITGKDQMERFLVAAIGLKVVVRGFLSLPGVQELVFLTNVIRNLEIFITAGLIYAAIVGLYDSLEGHFTTFKKVLYGLAILFVVLAWNPGSFIPAEVVNILSFALVVLGLVGGYLEAPKSADEAVERKGRQFLIAAVAFQLSSTAVSEIITGGFKMYQDILGSINTLLQKATIFTTTALLVIAFTSIFFVLDELSESSD